MKKVLVGVGLVLLLLILVVVLLPFLVDLNSYQAQYLPVIEQALNRKVTLKNIRLTILPRIGVRLSDFTVLDDPTFSAGSFATLNSLDIGVKLRPLLSKRVEVEEITLRNPVITVIKNRQGVLNTSTLGRKETPKPPGEAPPAPGEGPLHVLTMLAVDKVSITGGILTYRDESAPTPTAYILDKLEFFLKGVGLGRTALMHMAALVQPYNLPLKADGTVGPLQETLDLASINLDLSLGKTLFDIKGSAIGGDIKLVATSPGVNTADIPIALPLKKPIEAKDLQIAAELRPAQTRLQNLSFHLFGGEVKSQGGLATGATPSPFDGNVSVQGVQLGPVMDALGADKVSISGAAVANLSLHGKGFTMPDLTSFLEGTGHAVIKDGKIEGVNLLKEATELLKAAGIRQDLANATIFSTIETNLGIKRGIITVEQLSMDSHDFQALGTGTIGFDRSLMMKVNLILSEALSQSLAGTSTLTKVATTKGRITVPLVITGTTQAPAYALDMKAIGTKVQEQVKEQVKEKAGEFLKGKGGGDETLKKLFGQ